MKNAHLNPDLTLLMKLGSIIVHTDEMLSESGVEADRLTVLNLLNDLEVQEWVKAMGPLLPVKR